MEIGAFFILVLVLVVLGVIGGAIWAVASRGRRQQLSSKGGSLDAGTQTSAQQDSERPEHVEVDTEQQARFIGSR
jgi:hypothetical protein